MLSNHSRYAKEDIYGHDPGEIIDAFKHVESVLVYKIIREIYVNLYNNDLVWYIHLKELNSNTAFADNFNSTDENELSFNYTYSEENGEYKGCLQYPLFTDLRELYNFVINPTACVFPNIIDIVVDRIMHQDFVQHII